MACAFVQFFFPCGINPFGCLSTSVYIPFFVNDKEYLNKISYVLTAEGLSVQSINQILNLYSIVVPHIFIIETSSPFCSK